MRQVCQLLSPLCAALLSLASAQTAPSDPAPPEPDIAARLFTLIPPDYFGRFAGTTGFADSVNGYGVRGLPLPFKEDVRFTFISHPAYLEYAASLRYADTSYVAGRLENTDAGAALGVGHLEVTHNPYTGPQYGALLQDQGRSSRLTAGYAWANGPVRALAEAGYAVQGSVNAAYLHLGESAAVTLYNDSAFTFGVAATARSYTFFDQSQLSTDLSARFTVRPTHDSSVSIGQLERFVVGTSPIPDLNLTRYSLTSLDVTLAPKLTLFGPLSWQGAQYHFQRSWQASVDDANWLSATLRADLDPVVLDLTPHRDWVTNETGMRADLYYRSSAFPVLFGPSLDYLWTDNSRRWVFTVRAGVK